MPSKALITGASRGIGKAAATLFAKEGFELYLTCLHSYDTLENLRKTLETDTCIPCHIFRCDMSDESSVAALFSKISDLDVLVNNAGISYTGLFTDMKLSEWEFVLRTNLTSCFLTCRYAVPLMLKKKKGKIINVSSIWGSQGASMEVAYSASKGGLNAFTKALAKELAPSNIQVNAAAFGAIATDMMKAYSEEDLALIREEIPADRLGTPEEAADLILQLARSPEYLTGQILTMDGGWF